MYKQHYSYFLKAHPGKLHFASHSHHYWPDVTREAQVQYWDDCCRYVDHKWDYFYSQILPQTESLIRETLNLKSSKSLVFAPNTHELAFRLLSSLDWSRDRLNILTTDSEFYSFNRQINRLSELKQWNITKVPTEPFETFEERFVEAALAQPFDLIFFSQVFFNSGFAVDLDKVLPRLPKNTLTAVDGYHAFMALPTDLQPYESQIFYLAGSYKYAQGGEGACFMHVPPGTHHRPLNTGWFAELANLSRIGGDTPYSQDAHQYAGSTMDFSGIYRLRATLNLFKSLGLTSSKIHRFVRDNQEYVLSKLPASGAFNPHNVIRFDREYGHFLTFRMPSTEATLESVKKLQEKGIEVDSRKDRIRIGFGLYHDREDLDKLIEVLSSL